MNPRLLPLRIAVRIAAVSALAGGVLAVASLPASASTTDPYNVTITAPDTPPPAGDSFAITGTVSPSASGDDVQLQRQIHGSFETIATRALDGSSSYSFSRNYELAGPYVFRVVKPAGSGYDRGVSDTVRIFVTGDTLQSSHPLGPGDRLLSANGMYRLWMRPNGNLELALVSDGRVLWASRTGGHPGAWASLLRDGDLVVHGQGGQVLYDSGSGGHADGVYAVTLQDSGDLVITAPGGSDVWASGSVNDTLQATEALQPGQSLFSPDKRYQALMEDDGTFVLYDSERRTTLWDSYTAVAGSVVTMQSDGNLQMRGPNGKPLWSSRTSGHSDTRAVVQDDGDLALYQGGTEIWATDGVDGVRGDDYPAPLRNADRDSVVDPWRFYNRECVSFVAWRLNHTNHLEFSNFMGGGHFGNANTWDDNARKLGYTVDNTPEPGAVAQTDAGGYGHVAWVAAVGDGTVTIEDYNYSAPGEYGLRTVPTSSYVYIHLKDL